MKQLICSLLFVATAAHANDPSTKLEYKESRIGNVTIYPGESARARMNKKWVAHYDLTKSSMTGGGLRVGYYLTPNSILYAEVLSAAHFQSNYTSSGWLHADSSRWISSGYGVAYKRFFGNSLYLSAGLAYTWGGYEFQPSSLSAERLSFEAKTTWLTAGWGNQWQWDNFTLGVDWFGFAFPLANKFSNVAFNNSDYSYHVENHQRYYTSRESIYYLRAYLGASF